MNINIVTVGKRHDPQIVQAIEDYSSRISRYASLTWNIIPAEDKEGECKRILKSVQNCDHVILLDEKGKAMDTLALSKYFERMLNESVRNVGFIIGGAYGVTDEVKKRANLVLSISNLTFPHQIVRLILAEQIYRSFTIIKGEKYHHS